MLNIEAGRALNNRTNQACHSGTRLCQLINRKLPWSIFRTDGKRQALERGALELGKGDFAGLAGRSTGDDPGPRKLACTVELLCADQECMKCCLVIS